MSPTEGQREKEREKKDGLDKAGHANLSHCTYFPLTPLHFHYPVSVLLLFSLGFICVNLKDAESADVLSFSRDGCWGGRDSATLQLLPLLMNVESDP